MPTDPATVPPLTEQDVVRVIRQNDSACIGLSDADVLNAYRITIPCARAAYALAASRVDTAEVERRAARKALAECAAWLGKGESQPVRFDEDGRFLLAFERVNAFSDRYLAREYPAPAPRECVLSDGSVVIVERQFERFNRGNGTRYAGLHFWREILDDSDTGADFDALKRFAAEVGR